jgi:hypothetical protein
MTNFLLKNVLDDDTGSSTYSDTFNQIFVDISGENFSINKNILMSVSNRISWVAEMTMPEKFGEDRHFIVYMKLEEAETFQNLCLAVGAKLEVIDFLEKEKYPIEVRELIDTYWEISDEGVCRFLNNLVYEGAIGG